MSTKDPINWMLSDAIETLARAERLHQQFLNLQPWAGTREPSWEPPIDVLETDREVLILIALPGVDPNEVEAMIDKGTLVVSGHRVLPAELRNARILRLEAGEVVDMDPLHHDNNAGGPWANPCLLYTSDAADE